MLESLNRRLSARRAAARFNLGHLEIQAMEILWARGEGNVHDVLEQLGAARAYTTVMTTLDRLFKKGLLNRRKADRAFIYSPSLSRAEWEQQCAGALVQGFLAAPQASNSSLISCLVDAVSRHDAALLDELELQIRRKRRELEPEPRPP